MTAAGVGSAAGAAAATAAARNAAAAVAAMPLPGQAGPGCAACDNEAFRIFACLWGQVQLLRFCAMLSRRHTTLLEWLNPGSRGSVLLLSCILCVVTPDEATLVALVCASLVSTWAGFPDSADDGGIYEVLVHANLLAGLVWALATGRLACEALIVCGPAVRCIHMLVHVFNALARLNRDFHDVRCSSFTVVALGLLDSVAGDNAAGTWAAGVAKLLAKLLGSLSDSLVTSMLKLGIMTCQLASWAVPVLLWLGHPHLCLPIVWAMYAAPGAASILDVSDLSCLAVVSMPFWLPPRRVLALRWMTITPFGRCCSLAVATGLLFHALLPAGSRLLATRVRSMALVWLVAATPLLFAANLRSTAMLLIPTSGGAAGAAAFALESNHSNGATLLDDPDERVLQSGNCTNMDSIFVDGLMGDTPVVIHILAHITVLLALINGLCPYLGLKTRATWSSFSNLRVEAGVSNHFFIPEWLQVFGYTRECVTITQASVPMLRRHLACAGRLTAESGGAIVLAGYASRTSTETGVHADLPLTAADETADEDTVLPYALPFFELRRLIASETMFLHSTFVVEYFHWGAPHRFEVLHGLVSRSSDQRLAQAPPYMLRKLLCFRSFPANEERGLCSL